MSKFEDIENVVSRANGDLRSCRLATKDVLWPLLQSVLRGKRFAWRAGLRNTKGKEGEHPRPKQIVAIGLVAATKDGRITIGAALGVKREPRRGHCGYRGILDRDEVLVDPSLAWKEIGPWHLVEGKPWDQPSPSPVLLERIARWAEGAGPDRVTLTRAEAEEIVREHAPPAIHAFRFVLAPGWTLKQARAELKKARKDIEKKVVDPERNRWLGLRAEVLDDGSSVFCPNSIVMRADNRWPPCQTMTIPWEHSDSGFRAVWEIEERPFEGNLEWECPEFIEAVEVLADPKTGATVLMKPKREGAEDEGPDEPEEPPPRPDYGDKSDWTYRRTCSRVSSGRCVRCEGEAFHSAWTSGDRTLCPGCYMEHFEPEKAAAHKAEVKAAQEKRKVDLALALKGELPGAIVTESGTVLGPPTSVMGLASRQILREGFYDTKPFVPPKDQKPMSFFSTFKPTDDTKGQNP